MEEAFKKLESVDTRESSRTVSRLQKRLGRARDPQLLGELVDYYVASNSRQAAKVLSSLKDVQSQDFFSKLNECLHNKIPMRLAVLRLLAHCLNKQTSWLYKMVQHPLFSSILLNLKTSHDVLVLASGVLVLAAVLPLSPSHLSPHLPDVFQIFADLATVRTSDRLRLTPKPLYLHLDVAIYYLFLQLYSLFPCNFFTFLRGRYGPTGERRDFHQYIAPLFNFVQFHPGLVMDSNTSESHGDKWRAMEPDEIATLSLSMCLDLAITPPLEEDSDPTSVVPLPPSLHSTPHASPHGSIWEPSLFTEPTPLQDRAQSSTPRVTPQDPAVLLPLTHSKLPLSDPFSGVYPPSSATHSRQSSCYTSDGTPSPLKGPSPRNTRRQLARASDRHSGGNWTDNFVRVAPSCDRGTGANGKAVPSTDTANLAGFKSTKELSEIWSPSAMFDSSVSHEISRHPSRTSFTSQANTVHSSAISSPSPDSSAPASVPPTTQHTPRPMTAPTFTYKNYSPTASVDSVSLCRQPSNQPPATSVMTQSAHYQGPLEESPLAGGNMLTQSLYITPGAGRAGEMGRPFRDGRQGEPLQSMSLKNKFEKFFSIFSSTRKSPGAGDSSENEEFTEIYTSDVHHGRRLSNQRRSLEEGAESGDLGRGVSGARVTRERGGGAREDGGEEVGVEVMEEVEDRENGQRGGNGEVNILRDEDGNVEPDSAELGAQNSERRLLEEEGEDDSKEVGERDEEEATPDVSTQVPCLSASYQPETDIPVPETQRPVLPASFPGRTQHDGVRRAQRQRASQSESVAHTVQQVQERLQQLAESQEFTETAGGVDGEGEGGGEDGVSLKDCSNMFSLQEDGSESYPQQVSKTIEAVGSTNTLVASSSNPDFYSHSIAMAKSLESNGAGESPLSSSLRRERKGSRLFMRRVSVCDRKGVSFGTQTSALDFSSTLDFSPSPVVLLDQLVNHGEIMHEGNAQEIPLTELEGIDWFRFGGCPHNEELGQMQSQVALLHSQLLFERYQCLQHARRNRRLLSKARNAHRVREELEFLRQQVQRQAEMRGMLEQVQRSQEASPGAGEAGRLRSENRSLSRENRSLRGDNHRLTTELYRLQEENSRINKEVKEAGERLFALESERVHTQPQLVQARSLQEKVAMLERELLVLGELYHSQRDEALSLLAQGRGRQEWSQLAAVLTREKDVAESERASLQQEVEGLKVVVASLREESHRRQGENAALQRNLQRVQGKCQERIKATEEKYQAMLAVRHQLESHMTELRARGVMRKKLSTHRHKRSSSHPTGPSPSPAQTTPSPSPLTVHTPSLDRTS